MTSDEEHKKVVLSEIDALKIDKKKDLVYYTNEESISDDPDIDYKDITINLKEADTVNELLEDEMKSIRSSVKKTTEVTLDPNRELVFKDSDIYSAKERDYAVYESLKYLSIVITDSDFSCYTGSSITKQKAYTFSLSTGKALSNETLLGYASLSIDDVKNKIREKLENDQKDFTEGGSILVDETINIVNINNAIIYANKSGKIVISIVVKTTEDSYNDTIELN